MSRISSVFLLWTVACSATDDRKTTVVDCHALVCPEPTDIALAKDIYAEEFPEFDPAEPITAEWHAPGEVFRFFYDDQDRKHAVIAETPGGHYTRLSSFQALADELPRMQDWREGQRDDAREFIDEDKIRRVKARFTETFPIP